MNKWKVRHSLRSSFMASVFIALLLFSVPAQGASPERIVSLAPNVTEILFSLGLGDRIVGVSNFCDRPAEAKNRAKVGAIKDPSLESILSLKPDLVVIDRDVNPDGIGERLAKLGVKVHIFSAFRIRELPPAVRALGKASGKQKEAETLARRLEKSFREIGNKGKQRKRAVFILLPEPLVVAGAETPIDDAMNLLGMENVAAGSAARYPRYSLEGLIAAKPEIIFIGKGHADMRRASEGFLKKIAMIPAVRAGRVYFLGDGLFRMGPRIEEGLREMSVAAQGR